MFGKRTPVPIAAGVAVATNDVKDVIFTNYEEERVEILRRRAMVKEALIDAVSNIYEPVGDVTAESSLIDETCLHVSYTVQGTFKWTRVNVSLYHKSESNNYPAFRDIRALDGQRIAPREDSLLSFYRTGSFRISAAYEYGSLSSSCPYVYLTLNPAAEIDGTPQDNRAAKLKHPST